MSILLNCYEKPSEMFSLDQNFHNGMGRKETELYHIESRFIMNSYPFVAIGYDAIVKGTKNCYSAYLLHKKHQCLDMRAKRERVLSDKARHLKENVIISLTRNKTIKSK